MARYLHPQLIQNILFMAGRDTVTRQVVKHQKDTVGVFAVADSLGMFMLYLLQVVLYHLSIVFIEYLCGVSVRVFNGLPRPV